MMAEEEQERAQASDASEEPATRYPEAEPDTRALQCVLRPQPVPVLPTDLPHERERAILVGRSKWVNSTVLHYYFFNQGTDGENVALSDGSTRFVSWVGPEAQRDAVRQAFRTWKDLGIGLEFTEVQDRSEAEVKIGFMAGDGSWSRLGREVLNAGANERTMNFGWNLTTPYGRTTALHEIGHTLGLPHEHQNPFSGIRWDENRVYEYFKGAPNSWSRDQTFYNVLRKLSLADVEGSSWDPDSIMEYWFPAGLIVEPAQYRNGIDPPGTISPADRQYVLKWYPSQSPATQPTLVPFQSVPLSLKAAGQADFLIEPPGSRRYEIGTFGAADSVIVLFENINGQLRYIAGDDDSGSDRNARLSVKLLQGRKYVLRVRLYYAWASGMTAVMYW
jgi:hypothetical protein